jgi:PAS domain S-box-containing protein
MTWMAGRPNLVRLGARATMHYDEVIDALHPDDRVATRQAAVEAVRTNSLYKKEFRVVSPDGAIRWILSRGKVFQDETGKPVRMLGVNVDITERKRAETALRESDDRFRATFEHAGVGIAHVSMDSSFIMTNARLRAMFGYNEDEMRRLTVRDIVHPDDFPAAVEQRLQLFAGALPWYTQERRYLRKDGSVFVGEVTVSLARKPDGSPWYAILIISDVSQMRLVAEEMQRAMQAADAANVAKSQFLANVSHEIRTPLTSILGFAELLKAPADERKRAHYLDVIDRNGQVLKALIDDLLDLSKIEAGRLEVERSKVELQALLDELEVVVGREARTKGLRLTVERGEGLPHVIYTDAMRLRQVLLNVVGNAVKFTDEGGVTLTVTARPMASGGTIELSFRVEDTGVGIAAEHRAKLFQAFSQADASMARKFGGTGLGLVLSRHLARLLGGDLVLTASSPGKGSAFVATIVASSQAPHDPERTESGPSGGAERGPVTRLAGARILLVEDCADTRAFLVEMLTIAGAEVDVAENGRDGVERALAGRHSLVLMDMQMPVLDGITATRELRQRGYAKPVVAISAHAFASERSRCLASGCNAFIAKPVRSVELVEAVAAAMGRRT